MDMTKPLLLDLFCRMGGSTVGYQRAGFRVIGVDIAPQPGYPGDEFVQADVIEFLKSGDHRILAAALRHAGPPCQGQNTAVMTNRKRGIKDEHPALVGPTRDLLNAIGLPYVIEQPTSSAKGTIRRDVTLCMDMFKGQLPPPWVQKHRSFELGGDWPFRRIGATRLGAPQHPKHQGRVRGWRHGECFDGPYVAAYGKATAAEAAHAMQINWMQRKPTERENAFDLYEAIPPAYTEWLGGQFLARH